MKSGMWFIVVGIVTAVTMATIRLICLGPPSDSHPPTKPTSAKDSTKPRVALLVSAAMGVHTREQPT